jgi:hypothetical protein
LTPLVGLLAANPFSFAHLKKDDSAANRWLLVGFPIHHVTLDDRCRVKIRLVAGLSQGRTWF